MRQIGSRQESARIGGIGSCGRELCCSTWLSDFRSVNTTAARYQNIAINQTKLSGQCGRLKCCLNYELDTYMDALKHFPTHANVIKTQKGNASLVKTDIFKGIMYYAYDDVSMRGVFHPLDKEKVKEVLALNKKGVFPEDLTSFAEAKEVEKEIGFADVTGEIELPNKKSKKKKKKPVQGKGQPGSGQGRAPQDGENRGARNEGTPNRENRENRENRPNQQNRGNRGPASENRENRGTKPQNQGPRENRPQQNLPAGEEPRQNQGERQNRPPQPQGKPISDGPDTPPMPDNNGGETGQKKNFKKKKFFNKNKKNNNPS